MLGTEQINADIFHADVSRETSAKRVTLSCLSLVVKQLEQPL